MTTDDFVKGSLETLDLSASLVPSRTQDDTTRNEGRVSKQVDIPHLKPHTDSTDSTM